LPSDSAQCQDRATLAEHLVQRDVVDARQVDLLQQGRCALLCLVEHAPDLAIAPARAVERGQHLDDVPDRCGRDHPQRYNGSRKARRRHLQRVATRQLGIGGGELRLQHRSGPLTEVVDLLTSDVVFTGQISDDTVLALRGEGESGNLGCRGGG